MKVILLTDVPGTGKKNQILNVSDGFARNYLFPRKWAMEATGSAVKEVERRNEVERQKELERRQEAEKVAESLKNKVITIQAKTGDKGRLYGSVTGQASTIPPQGFRNHVFPFATAPIPVVSAAFRGGLLFPVLQVRRPAGGPVHRGV